ncbi:MAG: SDR family NAD(P)-dependent oxidoreductase, partial [Planococcus sp. (in: Bacteria)]|nr:SDR family NAD(P)-dependent oxidoreductase [Planococcus sp. (in: firmicutes)]
MFSTHENIAGRTAVITGGSGVLCSEMARQLAFQKVNVAILNRTAEKGQGVADEIKDAGGQAIAVAADVLDRDSLEKAKAQILEA